MDADADVFDNDNDDFRDERVQKTLRDIGPAVLNGGFSTFLAFSILIGSKSYVFKSFFKIFVLIVGFGLYNGLITLPLLLSVFGPPDKKGKSKVAPFNANQSDNGSSPVSTVVRERY